jgi:hypothetical protein
VIYESRKMPPLSRKNFARRVVLHATISLLLVMLSLVAGMLGYMVFENLAWRDAFLNSAMLLGGMGPVDAPRTDAGKIFAGLYALYSGLVFLIAAGIVLAPIGHRLLHTFHWDEK